LGQIITKGLKNQQMKSLVLNNKWLLLILLMGFTLPSCLKDKGYEDGEYGAIRDTEGQKFVSIPKGAKAANVLAIEAKDEAQAVNLFEVAYDYVNPAENDITVTLQLNNDLLAAYDTNVVALPADAYTMASQTVVIPKGKRLSDAFAISLTTGTLDATTVYGLGFTIVSTSDPAIKIPANLKNVIYAFTVKNKYDGEYTVTGTMVDNANPAITGYFPMRYQLITAGARVAEGFDPEVWEDYFVPITSAGAVSGYGAFSPVFTFDANDKIISVVNIYGQPAGNTRSAELDPSGANMYDPATKTIKVKFFMYQPSVIAGVRTAFDWTMVYSKPR
jgi:hypothetical protein